MNEIIFYYFFLLLSGTAITYLSGVLAFPIGKYFYGKYKDEGFQASKIIGLFLTGLIYLTLVTISSFFPIHIFKLNSIFTWLVCVTIFIFFEIKFLNRKLEDLFSDFDYKKTIKFEMIFILLFSVFLAINFLIKYDLASENLMNLAIFKKIQTQEKLPLSDFWLSGYNFNYYYFGHLVFSQYQILNGMDSSINYFLASSIIPSMLGTVFLILVGQYISKYSYLSLIILFGLTPIPSIIEYFNIPLTFNNKIFEIFKNNSVRPIPQAISENYSYTFLNIPVHAHVFSLLISIVIIYHLKLIFDNKIIPSFRSKEYIFLFILLGLSFLTNTWDFIFYLGILFFIIIFEFPEELKNNFKNLLINLEFLVFISILLSLPWFLFYQGPAIGMNIVKTQSTFYQFFSFWQVYFFIIGSFISLNYFLFKEKFDRYLIILIFYCLLILLIMELIFFMDATNERWNTYYKFSNQILLIFSLISGIYLSKILDKNRTWFLNIILILITVFSASGPLIYFFYKYDSIYLNKFYDANERLFSQKEDLIEAFDFINSKKIPNKKETILEYSGFAYKSTNMFSALSGMNSVMGWKNHEITWRLKRNIYEFVVHRDNEIKEIYTGLDLARTKELISKYEIDYILIGKNERENYSKINYLNIEKTGEKIFENDSVQIYKIDP